MYQKTIYHTLESGENVKFTILDRYIDNEKFYYAKVINIDLEPYTQLNDNEKEKFFGVEVTDGKQNSINYRNAEKLIEDLKGKYGQEWLETEK